MPVMNGFARHLFQTMDKVQLFTAIDCWHEMTWLLVPRFTVFSLLSLEEKFLG
jgi:hypothetical protein